MAKRAILACELPVKPMASVSLLCRVCGDTFSATRGDYWRDDSEKMMHCGKPMRLVRTRIEYRDIDPEQAEQR